jgi:hypothetical protein
VASESKACPRSGNPANVAHMKEADGSYVTVQFDKSLKVTGTIDGFGPGAPPSASSG